MNFKYNGKKRKGQRIKAKGLRGKSLALSVIVSGWCATNRGGGGVKKAGLPNRQPSLNF